MESKKTKAKSEEESVQGQVARPKVGSGETEKVKKKHSKFVLEKDTKGNQIFPIKINSSLRILRLGTIDYERPAYHSERNLFPIGFASEREHQSMNIQGQREIYTCEIKDGGAKPQYIVTCGNDVANSITRDSSTGCWVSSKISMNDGAFRLLFAIR